MQAARSRQVQAVREDLLRMSSRVEHALSRALLALEHWDVHTGLQVVAEDDAIDAARTALEEQVQHLLADPVPLTLDEVRILSACVAIAGELERAGDYAKGIARKIQYCLAAPLLIPPPPRLPAMAEQARAMLRASLDAFVRMDVDAAREIGRADDRVDAIEQELIRELVTTVRHDPARLECAVHLLDVLHTVERLADRATNIAERVIYLATQRMEQINQS